MSTANSLMKQRREQHPKLHPLETERETTVFLCKFSLSSLGQSLCHRHHQHCSCRLEKGGFVERMFSQSCGIVTRCHRHHKLASSSAKRNAAKYFFLTEGSVSVPAVQPHCQDWLHPWGGHTGRPVRILEALRRAVIGH